MAEQDSGPEYPEYPGADDAGGNAPPPPSPPAPVVTRPSSVARAVKLMWAGAALEVVARVLGLATGAYIGDDAPAQTPLGGVVAGAVVNAALWSWMAWENGLGRSYARIMATILGAIGIIRAFSGFFVIGAFGGGAVGLICSMILLGLAITILVLLWTKESSNYYRAVSSR